MVFFSPSVFLVLLSLSFLPLPVLPSASLPPLGCYLEAVTLFFLYELL
jgi:hypothetical protein